MFVTLSVCTVTWTAEWPSKSGIFQWNPARDVRSISAPPLQYSPTWPSGIVCSPLSATMTAIAATMTEREVDMNSDMA